MSTIVVGVDGSEYSRQALEWALQEARLRGARLEVVHAVMDTRSVMPYTVEEVGARFDAHRARAAAERLIDESGEPGGGAGGVEVDVVAEEGSAANVLVERSKAADLVVVGTRGHGSLSEVLLGSVSHQLVHHAHCPVVVLRGRR
jgi:nucleotide-binding universal stress UspA family protein